MMKIFYGTSLDSGGAPLSPAGSLEVDIPCMRIRMYPAMNEDHLSKGVANQLSTFRHIQPCISQALRIVGLEGVSFAATWGSYYNEHQHDDE